MEPTNNTITVETTVAAPVERAWERFTNPTDIINWNTPSPEWHTPRAENDLREGGSFNYRMEARDGSMGFDFGGVFTAVKPNESLYYTIGDGRKVSVHFSVSGTDTRVVETFEAESMNAIEMQRGGWQAILDSFKQYTESLG
jgi:uncharacterized protein YndB with AHSA1/START domain